MVFKDMSIDLNVYKLFLPLNIYHVPSASFLNFRPFVLILVCIMIVLTPAKQLSKYMHHCKGISFIQSLRIVPSLPSFSKCKETIIINQTEGDVTCLDIPSLYPKHFIIWLKFHRALFLNDKVM